jgi:signal transduction histidine kinase
VPTEREVSLPVTLPASDAGARPAELAEFAVARRETAALLERQADDIATRWEVQVRALLPEATGEDVTSSRVERAASVVRSLAASLAADGGASDDAVALGLAVGTAAFGGGAMLHHLLRTLDLLVAMCLFVMEEAVGNGAVRAGGIAGGIADGVRLSRRLQQAAGTITLAAARGYAQAAAGAMQERFRRLRHDLRNPLSTIRSALELMADESVPEEARRSPRFRDMIERNATALDRMIVARLGDAEVRSGAGTYQRIAPRIVACAVRRDLRADADARNVSVVVASGSQAVRVDAAGLELLLHNVLLAALHEATSGDTLTLQFPDSDSSRATLALDTSASRPPISDAGASERLTSLASALGAWLNISPERVTLTFPVVPDEREAPTPSPSLARGEARNDFGGTRQRDDRQAGTL